MAKNYAVYVNEAAPLQWTLWIEQAAVHGHIYVLGTVFTPHGDELSRLIEDLAALATHESVARLREAYDNLALTLDVELHYVD